MKKKCKELLDLVAVHGGGDGDGEVEKAEEESCEGPKLFGVRLGVKGEMEKKRKRGHEISKSSAGFLIHANN